MDKGKNEAMVTKFSEKFAIIMLEKHRKICRHGLTHLDATPIFKNRSDTNMDHPVDKITYFLWNKLVDLDILYTYFF